MLRKGIAFQQEKEPWGERVRSGQAFESFADAGQLKSCQSVRVKTTYPEACVLFETIFNAIFEGDETPTTGLTQ